MAGKQAPCMRMLGTYLGQVCDKRLVPPLIKLVHTHRELGVGRRDCRVAI